MFEIEKPITTIGIGVDQIPEEIRTSAILTGNDLGLLGSIESLPSKEEVESYPNIAGNPHKIAQELLKKGEIMGAWAILLK